MSDIVTHGDSDRQPPNEPTYTVGSLFSGIGGIDLAFAAAGFDVRWQVEIDPFCQKVLRKHAPHYWPNAQLHTDIYDCHDLPHVDVIVAGHPCQPFSLAGKRLGVNDDRYLVLELFRVIEEVRPYAALFENVPGFTSIDDGNTFADFLRALAQMGYDAEWGRVSAAGVGAPHKRERWVCVAYRDGTRVQGRAQAGNAGGGRAQAKQYTRRRDQVRRRLFRAGQIESGVCRDSNGISSRVDGNRGGLKYVTPNKTNTEKALCLLRSSTTSETVQRAARRLIGFQQEKVLRFNVHGDGKAKTRRHHWRVSQTSNRSPQSDMRTLRRNGTSTLSSYRRQSYEQQSVKCADVMRLMSYPASLGKWQVDPKEALQLRDLWEATRQVTSRDVRETLPALEEVWQSLSDQTKAWIAFRAGYSAGLNDWPWPAGIGHEQHDYEPPRVVTGAKNRTPRIKALGNAVVPQVVLPIAQAVREYLDAQAREGGAE